MRHIKQEKRKSWVFWVIFGILMFAFLSFGFDIGDYSHECNSTQIAQVDGVGIWRCAQINNTITTINKINIGVATELTINGGNVTINQSSHRIDTEGDAATDNLNCLQGGTEGDFVIIRPANSARDPTFVHNSLDCNNKDRMRFVESTNCVMVDTNDHAECWSFGQSAWVCDCMTT